MLASSVTLVLLSAVLPAFMAPTRKPDVPLVSDIVEELKTFQSQLRPLQEEFKKILELAVEKGTHEQSEKHKEHHEDAERQKKEEKDKEEEDFISRVAQTVASKLSVDDPLAKIERLVNLTSNYLEAKMNASHDHVYEFQSKLLGAVIKILNKRALKYEPPVNKSLLAAPKGVNESKVVQALEELLEGPLISGFVLQEQERQMIRSAIIALSKDFGISKLTTEDIIQTMLESNGKNKTAQPMTDEEKILGLEKMVEDKVTENNLNLDEMKYLVKGLAAAVGARNNLSEEKTKHLEEKIRKGGYEFFAKNKIPKNEASEISQLVNDKNVPEGLRQSQEKKDEDKDKRSFEDEDEKEDEDGILFELLGHLEKVWHEDKKSLVEAKKQKQYLKGILSNTLALMETYILETEQKQQHTESQNTSHTEEKAHTESEKSKHSEPTKQATNKPTNTHKENVRHTTEKQNVKSHASTKQMEKDENQPIEKRDGISDDLEKKIEEAETEIQRKVEIQQHKKEKKMIELGEKKKEKEKAKEKKQNSKICKFDHFYPVKFFCKKGIDVAEKEIENKLEEHAKVNVTTTMRSMTTTMRSMTTAKPATTKKNDAETNDELIKQLDDLFQSI